jgi:hypothetical protein
VISLNVCLVGAVLLVHLVAIEVQNHQRIDMSEITTQDAGAAESTQECDYKARKEAFEKWERLKARAPLGTVEEIIEWRNQR